MSVLERLWGSGHDAYLVGGCIRDSLLGGEVSDWDIASDARPEQVLRIFPGSTYQNRFGTVLARGLAVTTFRRDHRYADHRRPDSITFSDDIYEDLARRDLTINAMAWGQRAADSTPRLLDPADGQGDIEARLVRAVGDPARRFGEDALRLLRAIRIAARLEFVIEPLTWAAMVAHAGDVEYVSEERIGSEVRRMLAAPQPSRAVRLMEDVGVLTQVLPGLAAWAQAAGSEAAGGSGAGGSGAGGPEEGLAILDRASGADPGNERLALAALLRPLGPGDARAAAMRLRVGARDAEAIAEIILAAATPFDDTWSDADVRRFMGRVRDELLDDILELRRASCGQDEVQQALEANLAERMAEQRRAASPLALADLAVDGRDLRETLGIPEGPAVGLILERLLADVLDEPGLNSRSTLLTRASFVLDELVHHGRGTADNRSFG